ncbi:hypothetical protein F0L68_10255 [Solihabitans fulvus]|uniref:Uncharacterized protein n=1 Tax=Solihabitans fulvus TaxID=1892852 RepID=A0A5B2XJS4_9PSEU|nr:hypothetical protein [Solihabitans fulvus]KAA2263404.1 hypothetical protein F0L68_10255 [Solihabitans fulvus]
MQTLIGFVVGYLLGTSHGRNGVKKTLDSIEAIRNSDEVRQLVRAGVSVAGTAAKRVMNGGAGAMLHDAVEAFARRAAETTSSDPERRRAA